MARFGVPVYNTLYQSCCRIEGSPLFTRLAAQPKWRNWQTRRIQNPVPVTGVGVRVPPSALASHRISMSRNQPHSPAKRGVSAKRSARLSVRLSDGASSLNRTHRIASNVSKFVSPFLCTTRIGVVGPRGRLGLANWRRDSAACRGRRQVADADVRVVVHRQRDRRMPGEFLRGLGMNAGSGQHADELMPQSMKVELPALRRRR